MTFKEKFELEHRNELCYTNKLKHKLNGLTYIKDINIKDKY